MDDMTLTTTLPDNTKEEDERKTITELMEAIIQDFERKLYVTGGELSLPKSFWYLIFWNWQDNGSATMATKEEVPAEINLTQGAGTEKTKLERKEYNSCMRTLGAMVCPAKNMDKQVEHATKQCETWKCAMENNKLRRDCSYKAYNNVLIPKIAYTFSVTTISKKDMRKLQKIVDPMYLPRLGLNRSFPKAILQGPSDYGGLEHEVRGQTENRTNQNVHREHKKQEDTEKLIRCSLEILQIEAGIRGSVLNTKTTQSFEN